MAIMFSMSACSVNCQASLCEGGQPYTSYCMHQTLQAPNVEVNACKGVSPQLDCVKHCSSMLGAECSTYRASCHTPCKSASKTDL